MNVALYVSFRNMRVTSPKYYAYLTSFCFPGKYDATGEEMMLLPGQCRLNFGSLTVSVVKIRFFVFIRSVDYTGSDSQ